MPDSETITKAMKILLESGGTLTDEVKEQLLAIGITQEQMEQFQEMISRFGASNFGGFSFGNSPFGGAQSQDGQQTTQQGQGKGKGQGMTRPNAPSFGGGGMTASATNTDNFLLIAVLVVVLLRLLFLQQPISVDIKQKIKHKTRGFTRGFCALNIRILMRGSISDRGCPPFCSCQPELWASLQRGR